MSLEQSMEKFAAALDKSAEALNKHTEVMERALEQGVALIGPTAGGDATAAPAKPEPVKRGPKPKKEESKAEPDTNKPDDDFGSEEPDDFADEPEDTKVTAEQIKDLMFKVKDKKGVDAARAILAEVGVKTIAQIPEASFNKVLALAGKAGVKL